MDKIEAKRLLTRELEPYRAQPYEALVRMIGHTETYEITGTSGTVYQVEILALWDDKTESNVRVWGNIDGGGWRAFVPVTISFIKAPTGEFVGE